MLRHFLLPGLAVIGVGVGIYTVQVSTRGAAASTTDNEQALAASPAAKPFASSIAGTGLVEASSDNIAIAPPIAGVVRSINVKVGDFVTAGDVLLVVDNRDAAAALTIAKAELASAGADLSRLRALPRPEDVPIADALVAETEARFADAERELSRLQSAFDASAANSDEVDRARFAMQVARAQLASAEARRDRVVAGAWQEELAVAAAAVEAATARVRAAQVHLDRHAVTASVGGTVLRMNARVGEFLTAAALGEPEVMIGDTEKLHVRVDIDENEAWRFQPGAAATVFIRGNPNQSAAAEFVRVEPYVLPKRSLTGESTERVDTRVLQVIYAFDPVELPAYVGQQMDVYVDATLVQ